MCLCMGDNVLKGDSDKGNWSWRVQGIWVSTIQGGQLTWSHPPPTSGKQPFIPNTHRRQGYQLSPESVLSSMHIVPFCVGSQLPAPSAVANSYVIWLGMTHVSETRDDTASYGVSNLSWPEVRKYWVPEVWHVFFSSMGLWSNLSLLLRAATFCDLRFFWGCKFRDCDGARHPVTSVAA